MMLKYLGAKAIIAESFARIFFRNSINLGLPLLECKNISSKVADKDKLELDLRNGRIRNITKGEEYSATKLPDFLLQMLEAGGAIEMLKKQL
jgi:3-isopropylmalate/(R)-2-methylmalate dehydratase small subunit